MKRKNAVISATIFVALITVISKLLGFVREALIAAFFGANAVTDAFFFAQSMPEMIFPSVCSSLSTAFISVYVTKKAQDAAEGNKYAFRISVFSILLGIVLSVIGVFFAPFLVRLFAPGFSESQIVLTTKLSRITMAAFVLIMFRYMGMAVLNSNKIFVSAQLVGLLYNIVIILLTVALGRGRSMETLAVTVVIAEITYAVGLSVLTIKHKILLKPDSFINIAEIKELTRLTLPILIGNAVVQINTIVDKMLGSSLPGGTVSALSYSHSLCNIVTGVFIISLSTVLYPTLTNYIAKGETENFTRSFCGCMKGLAAVLIPISIIIFAGSREIVSILFERGNFDAEAVGYTSYALKFYCPMFLFFGIREVVAKAFFSMQETKKPMINTSVGVAVNVVCSIILSRYLGIGGIALGTSISAIITAILFIISIKREVRYLELKPFYNSLFLQLLSGVIVYFVYIALGHFVCGNVLLTFVAKSMVCALIYVIIVLVIDKEYRGIFLSLLKRRERRGGKD